MEWQFLGDNCSSSMLIIFRLSAANCIKYRTAYLKLDFNIEFVNGLCVKFNKDIK